MDISARPAWGAVVASSRLGWEVSSNWTRPLLFVIYSVLRPISATLILVVMYRAIRGGGASVTSYLAFLVTGVAFWAFVQNSLAGFANAMGEDRGRFRMLKYVYAAPQPFPLYLIGRGGAQLGSAAVSVVIVLISTTIVLRLPINPFHVNYVLLTAACMLAFGAILSLAMGYSLALLAARDSYGYGELAAQMLFIVSGAIFPLSVLPGPLAAVGSLSPLAYWLELVRRALLQGNALHMFPLLSDQEVLLRLLLTTVLTAAFAWLLYRWADRRARRIGLLDLETNW